MNQQKCPECGNTFNIVHIYKTNNRYKTRCGNCGMELDPEHMVELTDAQTSRCDEIYKSVIETCRVIIDDDSLELGKEIIENITNLVVKALAKYAAARGKECLYFPSVVVDNDGSQHIEKFPNVTSSFEGLNLDKAIEWTLSQMKI